MTTTKPTLQPDVTLLLDMDGVIREATLSPAMGGERVDGWLGRPWTEVADDVGSRKIRRMVDDARVTGISAFRQINQRFPSGLEVPLEFTTVLLGGRAGMLAIGKNLQAVAELQSRLISAQQTIERDYWKLREVETRYRLVFDGSAEAVAIVSVANFRIVEANRAALEALGARSRRNEDIAGRDLFQDIALADRDRARDMLARVREHGKALSILVHLGPDARPWMLRGSLLAAESGNVYLLQFTSAAALPAVKPAVKSTIDGLIAALPDGFVAIDARGLIRNANHSFADLVQLGTPAAVEGELLSRWLHQPGADVAALLDAIERHGRVRLFSTTLRGELGSEIAVEISAGREQDTADALIGVVVRNVAPRVPSQNESDMLRGALGSLGEQVGKSPLRSLVKTTVGIVEEHYVREALVLAGGNRTATAELLGLSRQSLYAKLNRYGLDDKSADPEEASED